MSEGRKGLMGLFKKAADEPVEPSSETPEAPSQQEMRLRIADFASARVEDVMIPRAEIIAVELSTSMEDLIQLYANEAHSRLPVYRETLDDPVGVVHIRDLIGEIARANGEGPKDDDTPLERLRRDILFVPPSMPLPDLLVKMQASRTHLALVVDEYGGTDGLVSLEDLVEEIVGEIEDEHDETPEALIVPIGEGMWDCDARAELEDVAEMVDPRLEEVEESVDTLGGLAFVLAEQVPPVGAIVEHPSGWRIEVTAGDEKHVTRLRLHAPAVENEVQ